MRIPNRKILPLLVLLPLLAVSVLSAGGDDPATNQRNRVREREPRLLGRRLGDLSFGVNPRLGVGVPSQRMDSYSVFPQCGMGVARISVHWKDCEPEQGVFTWDGLDFKVWALQNQGLDICMTLITDAEWGVEPSEFPAANHPPADMADWTAFMGALVERYDGDGVDDVESLLRPVQSYQVASEWPSPQNLGGGWTGTIDQLIDFFNATYDAVKAADSTAAVILGGIASISLDAMVLNAGMADYTARLSYSETVQDSLTLEMAQDPRVAEAVADKERVLAESRYDMVDLHLYGPVEYNQYRIARIRQSVGAVPLVSTEGGGPNLAYEPDFTPDDHFLTALDWNLDGLSRGMIFMMWLSMFGQDYVPGEGPTWGNSRLQLIDMYRNPTGGFWAYHLLAALMDDAVSVEKAGPGAYIIHRYHRPDIHIAWRTAESSVYQLPPAVQPRYMMEITDALYGYYRIVSPPAGGLLTLNTLPVVVSEDLPGLGFGSSGAEEPLAGAVGLTGVGNRPNPFNPATEIRFALSRDSRVRVDVFDLRGRRVDLLLDADLQAGVHGVRWDAAGQPSGTYVYRVTAGGSVRTGRCLLAK